MTTPHPYYFEHIHQLIAINNERYRVYSKAYNKSDDPDFKSLCQQNKERTLHFNVQLIRALADCDVIPRLRPRPGLFSPSRRKLLRRWWRAGILLTALRVNRATCRWWDNVALKSYRNVLDNLQNLPKELARVLRLQESIQENDQRLVRLTRLTF